MENKAPILCLLLCLFACISFHPSLGQAPAHPKSCALFFSANDYCAANAKLAVAPAGPEVQEFAAIHLRTKRLVARIEDKRILVAKDSLFGYRLRNQKCYRWENTSHRAFEILEHRAVVIYSIPEPQYTSKGYALKPAIYFSRNLDSPIRRLTVLEVKRAFPEVHSLHLELDLLPDPAIIARFDEASHTFLLQQLIENHIHQH